LDYESPQYGKVQPLGVLQYAINLGLVSWPDGIRDIGVRNANVINDALQRNGYATTFYFPSCVIPIANTLKIENPVTILGDGLGSVLYFVNFDPHSVGILVRPLKGTDSMLTGVRMRDIALAGPPNACGDVLNIRALFYSRFENVFIRCGASTAVMFDTDFTHDYSQDCFGNYFNFLIGNIVTLPLVPETAGSHGEIRLLTDPDKGVVVTGPRRPNQTIAGPNFNSNRLHCHVTGLSGDAVSIDFGPNTKVPGVDGTQAPGMCTAISGVYQKNGGFGISIQYGFKMTIREAYIESNRKGNLDVGTCKDLCQALDVWTPS
jgi:hypothetical protein